MIPQETILTLRQLAERYEEAGFINGDPSWWMHQVNGEENQEAVAFVAASLSYGSRTQFMPKIEQLLNKAQGDMAMWIRNREYARTFAPNDEHCFYRLYNHGTMRAFFDAYSQLIDEHTSLKQYVASTAPTCALDVVKTLCNWFFAHGDMHVTPRNAISSCKRLCMFLRWMVRDNSPVDLGHWADVVDKRTLIIPMDTHVLSEANKLGLIHGRNATMQAALKLTDTLREVFPSDPTKADFALFGLGINPQ
ncbi:MAG: TIGR02757 family protein [Bacteroidales bacterium]|nr:TIGR02757 family protein [Bacteroidales bacterium]MBR1850659.1 TIGR02757 family protein [Bacteroidales bacterium]